MYFITWTNSAGKIRPDHSDMIKEYLVARPNKEFFLEIYEKKPRRSIPQNKKFHAMIRCGAEQLREDMKEKGNPDYAKLSDKIIKSVICHIYLTNKEAINGKEFTYTRSTSDLDVEEMSDLITNTYVFFGERGIELP